MREYFSLLLSFRKYFRKYSFMLFLFILLVVLVSVYSSIMNDIELSYIYHDSSVIKGDCRLSMDTEDYEIVSAAFRRAVEASGGTVTEEYVVRPAQKIYALTGSGERVYYDLTPSDELKGNEIIIFSEYIPDEDFAFYDSYLGESVDVSLLVDDGRGVNLGLNIYEAICSEEVYSAVAERNYTYTDKPYYGEVDYTIDGDVDYSSVLAAFVSDGEIVQLASGNAGTDSVTLIDNHPGKYSSVRYTYTYYFSYGVSREGRVSMYRRFTVELMNELDRLKMPLYILNNFISSLKNLVFVAFIFISYSIFRVRESEFSIYRSLGMTKARLAFLLFLEEVVMLLFIAAVSFLLILLVILLLNFIRPLGDRLVDGEALYFRDIFTYCGRYSMSRVWLYYLENMINLTVVFPVISFLMNYVLLCLKERRDRRI
jgi:ABC-type antimicrobial peptide transport system permease subunit